MAARPAQQRASASANQATTIVHVPQGAARRLPLGAHAPVTSARMFAELPYATDTNGWRHRRLWPRGASCHRRDQRSRTQYAAPGARGRSPSVPVTSLQPVKALVGQHARARAPSRQTGRHGDMTRIRFDACEFGIVFLHLVPYCWLTTGAPPVLMRSSSSTVRNW